MTSVAAYPGDEGRQDRMVSAQQNEQRAAEQRQYEQRQYEQRQYEQRARYEAHAEAQRRAVQEAARNADMSRRPGRLTPDERRDLRRQINEVGQDLYSNPPRR